MDETYNAKRSHLYFITGIGIGALVMWIFLSFYLDSQNHAALAAGDVVKLRPAISVEKRIGTASLTREDEQSVLEHKNAILKRIASPEPLTSVERQMLGQVLLVDWAFYSFSQEENAAIIRALEQ